MIESNILSFREIHTTDIPRFCEYTAKEEYLKYLPFEPPVTPGFETFLKLSIEQQTVQPRSWYFLAVCLKSNPKVIGEAVLKGIDHRNKAAEIGWGLDPVFWGSGYGAEIGRTLIHYGFSHLNLHRITALTAIDNLASVRIMEKIGMKREGILREHFFAKRKWWSSYQYSILDSDVLLQGSLQSTSSL